MSELTRLQEISVNVLADPVWVDAGGKGGKQHDKRWAVSLRREGKH